VRIAVVGSGGIGGYYGARLTETLESAYADRPSPGRRNDETSAVTKGKREKS
jgi:ketopantoate reductase